MRRRLPPLNALRAFEAAARHGSFKAAAEELGVTPGAVSQQVKALEAWLGRRLFDRLHRGLEITDAGARLGLGLGQALDGIADAVAEASLAPGRTAGSDTIAITVLPALAEKWLVPRLPAFRARHPDADIRISADERIVDLAAEPFDFAFRYRAGGHADDGIQSAVLFRDRMTPVCSAALAAGPPPLEAPGDLARQMLLHDTHWRGDWARWLAAAGVQVDPDRGSVFNRYGLAVQAAADGLGVLVGHRALLAGDLAAGRLVEPFELAVPAPGTHLLVWHDSRRVTGARAAFRDWVLEEAETTAREAHLEIAT